VPELAYVRPVDGGVAIGALTRQHALERSDGMASRLPIVDHPGGAVKVSGYSRGVNARVAILACLGLTLGGCATAANTAQQTLAYERWGRCNAPYVQLDRVDVDGRITFMFSNWSTRQEVVQCLAEAGRGGPPLPEPVAVPPRGGP
jgi:hypothetical protein